MNNEPVAWMCPTGLEYKQRATDFMYNDALYDTKLNWIPLYTHPVKNLTDDELFKVYADLQEGYTGNNFPVDLGRAILKKAQEK